MASLSPKAAAAIARLRSYIPPSPTTWYSLPQTRRAAVLILLYADKQGELRVVLTMRSSLLKSYSGQAALPGGKADSLAESPMECARREAMEEIGLPMPALAPTASAAAAQQDVAGMLPTAGTSSFDAASYEYAGEPNVVAETKFSPETPGLPYPFRIEHLCQLPTNLAKTELGVRPCVAFLYATSPVDRRNEPVDAETMLIPRLDAKEVAAVFSAPFHNFLLKHDELHEARKVEGKWYKGSWMDWHETRFRMHNFYVPIKGQVVTRPPPSPSASTSTSADADASAADPTSSSSSSIPTSSIPPTSNNNTNSKDGNKATTTTSTGYPRLLRSRKSASTHLPYSAHPLPFSAANPDPLDALQRYRVFGMTARILVDCARVAFAEDPEFEHNTHFGDEAIIARLISIGKLDREREKGAEFVGDDVKRLLELYNASTPGNSSDNSGGAGTKRKRGWLGAFTGKL